MRSKRWCACGNVFVQELAAPVVPSVPEDVWVQVEFEQTASDSVVCSNEAVAV